MEGEEKEEEGEEEEEEGEGGGRMVLCLSYCRAYNGVM